VPNKPFYITTPIYYVNDVPHLGNAYCTIAADVQARYQRMKGRRVLFLTGTDENAGKVSGAAADQGKGCQEWCDELAQRFMDVWRDCHVSYDDFIRTTQERHRRIVAKFVERLYASGDIYLGSYSGWYCPFDETFFPESELNEGKCPNAECRREVQWVEEPAYFFRLSAYAERLLEHLEQHPEFLQPEFRRNEVVSFLKSGLQDTCITRKLEWGIPLPASIPQSEGLVVYVWFDALINYLSAVGFESESDEERAKFDSFWPADVHLVGKDIYVRFHCTLWPAMLMAAGVPVPKRVFGHGFWNIEGEKMSKSRGNMIHPVVLADELAAAAGCSRDTAVDAIRYHLLREVTFGLDGDFQRAALEHRFNSDLANDLGNLLNRTLTMVHRYCGGRAPAGEPGKLLTLTREKLPVVSQSLERLDYSRALTDLWELVSAANRYIEEQKPWELKKAGDQQAVDATMREVLCALRAITLALTPFMPTATQLLWTQLGLPGTPAEAGWDSITDWSALPVGNPVAKPEPVFPRLDRQPHPASSQSAIPKEPASPQSAIRNLQSAIPRGPAMPEITYDEFKKVELKTCVVKTAEKIEGADKLLRLIVDLGTEERQIVAGIAQQFAPETLIGKQLVVVANLAPAKIRGVESRGMLLAAGDEVPLALITPSTEVPPGSTVR
jgi:methionyl-tRNA synthetase